MAEQHPVDTFSANKHVLMGNRMRTRARARIPPRERLRQIYVHITHNPPPYKKWSFCFYLEFMLLYFC